MNDSTVLKQRGWSAADERDTNPGAGLTGAMTGLKGNRNGLSATKDVRETAEEVAARLNRSFKVRVSLDGVLLCVEL